MQGLLTLYRNWRHTKGYGVHSPYAYMLVTEILSLPRGYAYYDEDSLPVSAMPRLAVALQRYQWRFGKVPAVLDAQEALSAINEGKVPVAVVAPLHSLVEEIKAHAESGVLFHNRKALVYFPNDKVRFVAYGYRF